MLSFCNLVLNPYVSCLLRFNFWLKCFLYLAGVRGSGPHPAVLRGYSRLWAQQPHLMCLGDHIGCWGLNPGQLHAKQVPSPLYYLWPWAKSVSYIHRVSLLCDLSGVQWWKTSVRSVSTFFRFKPFSVLCDSSDVQLGRNYRRKSSDILYIHRASLLYEFSGGQ